MEDHKDSKSTDRALADCEKTVQHLREENAELRHSAQTFGDLAERLNTQRASRGKRRKPRTRSLPQQG